MDQDDRVLADRRRALEEAFFAKQNEKLKAKMRASQEREKALQELRAAFPHGSGELFERLIEQGLDVEAVSALSLVPCVMVAWADGHVGDGEREVVLAAARENGIEPGSKPYTLLAGWLVEKPSPSLVDLWCGYVGAACAMLGPAERDRLRERVAGLARAVARATGGFLGIGKISDEEEAVLTRIEQAFPRGA